ncbi:MAG: Flp family type IVb pilin [Deltaproteobacteria bacterium]|nr:Flp family type IVb pilin [Deltaproteobacteria bacterium]
MPSLIRAFARDEDGLEMLEWAIVGALIVTISTAAITTIGNDLAIRFSNLDTLITTLP